MATVTPHSIVAVGIALPLLATLFVALRIFVRCRYIQYRFKADDVLIIFAWAFCIGLGIMMIIGGVEDALGQPTSYDDYEYTGYVNVYSPSLVTTEKMRFASNLASTIALGAVKLSVLMFYRRIFSGKNFDLVSRILVALTVAWTIAIFFAVLFACGTNISDGWSTLNKLRIYCSNQYPIQQAMTISDFVIDICILLVPIPLVYRLHMSVNNKLAVLGAFSTGVIAVTIAVVRYVKFRLRYTEFQIVTWFVWKPDLNHLASTLIYWTMVELSLSIIAACLPTLGPLLDSLFGSHDIEVQHAGTQGGITYDSSVKEGNLSSKERHNDY